MNASLISLTPISNFSWLLLIGSEEVVGKFYTRLSVLAFWSSKKSEQRRLHVGKTYHSQVDGSRTKLRGHMNVDEILEVEICTVDHAFDHALYDRNLFRVRSVIVVAENCCLLSIRVHGEAWLIAR